MSSGLLPEPRTHDGLWDRRAQRPGQPGEPVRANGAGACSRCHRRGLIYSLCSAVLLLAALGCWAASAWAEQLKPFDWYAVAVRLVYTSVRLGNWPKIADSVAVCLALLLWLEEPQPRAAENSTAESCSTVGLILARFRIYGKIQKWYGKREGVYPARICGIPFLAGIIPY